MVCTFQLNQTYQLDLFVKRLNWNSSISNRSHWISSISNRVDFSNRPPSSKFQLPLWQEGCVFWTHNFPNEFFRNNWRGWQRLNWYLKGWTHANNKSKCTRKVHLYLEINKSSLEIWQFYYYLMSKIHKQIPNPIGMKFRTDVTNTKIPVHWIPLLNSSLFWINSSKYFFCSKRQEKLLVLNMSKWDNYYK